MDDRIKKSMMILDRGRVPYTPKRPKILKGMAIVFLVFAPFLGVCELMEPANGPVVVEKSERIATVKNKALPKISDFGTHPSGSAKIDDRIN